MKIHPKLVLAIGGIPYNNRCQIPNTAGERRCNKRKEFGKSRSTLASISPSTSAPRVISCFPDNLISEGPASAWKDLCVRPSTNSIHESANDFLFSYKFYFWETCVSQLLQPRLSWDDISRYLKKKPGNNLHKVLSWLLNQFFVMNILWIGWWQ